MKTLTIIIFTLVSLTACQKQLAWTRIDGDSTRESRLQAARKACRIDIKLAGVERAEQDRDEKIRRSASDLAKSQAKNEYEQIRRQVYREIDTCMNKKGYKR